MLSLEQILIEMFDYQNKTRKNCIDSHTESVKRLIALDKLPSMAGAPFPFRERIYRCEIEKRIPEALLSPVPWVRELTESYLRNKNV